jgi:SAM-dependent methyltransferase
MNVVRKYYDETAEIEWTRLRRNPYRRLEHIITTHFLGKYLPQTGLVLDAGGGPGRYAIQLARKGYDVVLLDLSPKCLELAEKQIKRAGVRNRVKQVVEGSILDLNMFSEEQFDAVLCLGPFSHLTEKEQKEKAASEIARVAKKAAPIFVSVIGLYGVLRTILQRLQDELLDPAHQELYNFGIHRARPVPHKGGRGFARVDACFYHPTEVKTLFESRGVKTLEMATCEGLSSHLMGPTNRLYRDKKKWEKWMEIMLKTCTDPILLGTGEHFLYIGQKQKKERL